MPLVPTPKRCDASVKKAIQILTQKLGLKSVPIHANLTLTDLTASSIVGTNASKLLESVTIGTGLDYTRPALSLSHLGIENLTDPGADRIFFWDDSASASKWLSVGPSLAITATNLDAIQDIRTTASPTFAGLTLTNAAVIGSNSVVFQPGADSTTFLQVLDAGGGTPIFNVDTTNERVEIGATTPGLYMLAPFNITGKATNINDRYAGIWIRGKTAGNIVQINVRGSRLEIGGGVSLDTTPAMSVDYLTGNLTVASGIELGHATDTTITRVSAGVIAVEGVTVMMVGDAPTAHSIASHDDTTGTGAELNTLTGGGDVGALHTHAATYQPLDDVLTDISALAVVANNELIVGTGAGTYAHENVDTVATLMGLGAGDSPTFAALTLTIIVAEGTDVNKFLVDSSGVIKYRTGAQVLSDIGGSASGHNHDGTYEPADAGLTSLAGLTYAAAAFVKMTGADTFVLRTIANVRTDLSITNVENTALSTWAGTTNITTLGTIATVGNITIANGGTIGQAAGPLITFNDTANILEIAQCLGGVQVVTSGTNSQSVMYFTGYNDQTVYTPEFQVRKSHNDTKGVLTTTLDTETLGLFRFRGVDDGNNWDDGAIIAATQNGAAGVKVPTNLVIYTFSSTAPNTNQLVLHNSGGIFMHTLKSGTDQTDAGAAANELYHDTDDHTIKIGT